MDAAKTGKTRIFRHFGYISIFFLLAAIMGLLWPGGKIWAGPAMPALQAHSHMPDIVELPQISREMIFSPSSPASRRTSRANSRLAGMLGGKIRPAKVRKFQHIGYQ